MIFKYIITGPAAQGPPHSITILSNLITITNSSNYIETSVSRPGREVERGRGGRGGMLMLNIKREEINKFLVPSERTVHQRPSE